MKVRKIILSATTLALISSFAATSVFAADNHNNKRDRQYQNFYGQYNQRLNDNTGLSFNDLGNYSWAQNAIEQLAKRGIVHGVGNQQFNPGGNLTRGQLHTLLNNYFGQNTAVSSNDNDDQYMTRAETIQSIIQNLVNNGTLQLPSSTDTDQILSQYQDADRIPYNLRQYIATAIRHGIIHGTSANTFDPSGRLTRAQIATILYNLQGLQGLQGQVPTVPYSNGYTGELPPGGTTSLTGTTTVNNPNVMINQTGTTSFTQGQSISLLLNEAGYAYIVENNYNNGSIPATPTTKTQLDTMLTQNSVPGTSTYVAQPSTISLQTSALPVGSYTIYFTDVNGNVVANLPVTINYASTGITNVTDNAYTDSYNNTHLTVNVTSSGISDGTTVNVSLVDASGNSYASAAGTISGNTASVDLPIPSTLSGSYTIKVTAGSYVNSSTTYSR